MRGPAIAAVVVALGIALGACAPRPAPPAAPPPKKAKAAPKRAAALPPPRGGAVAPGTVLEGKATWYGGKWHGRKTASGEVYDKRSLTAAHRTLPFGTRVRVTNLVNGKSVVVRINNRGPFGKKKERIIDVSERAAQELDFVKRGVVPVRIEVLP